MVALPELLQKVVEVQGWDLHITTKTPPQIRIHGHLERLELPELSPADTKQLTYSVLTDTQKKRFEETLEARLLVRRPGPRAFPLQHVPSARLQWAPFIG